MKVRYITIEREYGSGGTQIARLVSQQTGIPCYGREILEAVSKKYNISVEQIERYEETVSNSFLFTIYAMTQARAGSTDMLSKEGYVFLAEQAVIQQMAMDGKAIFLGHCASEALKRAKGVLKVYIRCSDEAQKRQRIISTYGIQEANVDKTKKRFDKKRSNYFYANTGKRWEDLKNYDLVLDSAVLGIEGCVAILKGLID